MDELKCKVLEDVEKQIWYANKQIELTKRKEKEEQEIIPLL